MGLISFLRRRLGIMDRRREPRIPVNLPADFSHEEDESVFLFHNTLDISSGGAFVQTEELLDLGTVIELDLTLHGGTDFGAPLLQIKCTASVAHLVDKSDPAGRPSGLGLRFLDLKNDDWEQIRAFIERPREGPDGDASSRPRLGVNIVEMDEGDVQKKLEEIARVKPELEQEVAAFTWDSQGPHWTKLDAETSVSDADLIAEIEERMQTDGPDLRAVADGETAAHRSRTSFEVRSDGTIEAKRASDDLGLVSNVVGDEDEDSGADRTAEDKPRTTFLVKKKKKLRKRWR